MRLKRELGNLTKPYNYQTRRGDKPPNLQKFREDGKLRQIMFDTAGQYMMATRDDPVIAYKNKGNIFLYHRETAFPKDVTALEVLFAWKAGEACKKIIKQKLAEVDEDPDTKSILKKGGAYFCAAVLVQLAYLRNGPGFDKQAKETSITSKAADARIAKYAKMAVSQYVKSVKALWRKSDQELGTLIKRPDFFKSVRQVVKEGYEELEFAPKYLEEALPILNN